MFDSLRAMARIARKSIEASIVGIFLSPNSLRTSSKSFALDKFSANDRIRVIIARQTMKLTNIANTQEIVQRKVPVLKFLYGSVHVIN